VRLERFTMDPAGKNIVVSNDTMVYTLTCNPKQDTCITPLPDTDYQYIDRGEKLETLKSFLGSYTKGDTVGLVPENGSPGIYVLWEAHRNQEGK
jgi:hypothetical protein